MTAPFRQGDVVAEPILQAVGEAYLAVEYHAGENFPAKHLADRSKTKHRIGVGLLVALVADFPESGKRHLAIAHGDEYKARDLGIDECQRAREIDRFVQEFVLSARWSGKRDLSGSNRRNAGENDPPSKHALLPLCRECPNSIMLCWRACKAGGSSVDALVRGKPISMPAPPRLPFRDWD